MRFSRAIIVNPPNPPGFVSNKDSMGGFGQLFPSGAPSFPPLDIPYLAASLIESGCEVRVIEAGALGLTTDELIDELKTHGTDPEFVVVFVRPSLPTIDFDLHVCGEIKRRVAIGAIVLFGPVTQPLSHLIEQEPSVDFKIGR